MNFSDTDISLLHASALFEALPDPSMYEAALRDPDNQLRLVPGTVLVEAGTRPGALYVIAHGTIELVAESGAGCEKIVDFVRTGGLVGEEALFGDTLLRYSARTITAAAVLRLPEAVVAEWLAASPVFMQRLMSLLARRTEYLEKDLVTFCTKNATARLVCYLVCGFESTPETPDGSYTVTLSLPLNKLASRLGVSDSHLSRAFRELERLGLIAKTRGGLFVPDVKALSGYVCPGGCDL